MDARLAAARRIRRVLKDRSGNVLPLAAVGVFVMAALAGGAVDMGRAYRIQNRLQNACDAAVLSGRRAVTSNGYDAAAQAQAKRYFDINFDEVQQGSKTTVFLTSSDNPGTAIGGKASTQMPMLLMQLFGAPSMTISVNCAATMGVGNSDVTMVLDTTGSMSGTMGSTTRIAALRVAMKNFHATVATAMQGTNARVRYSVVPFSSAVNVGRILHDENPNFLVDEYAIQSVVPVYVTNTTVRYKKASINLNSEVYTYTAVPNSGWAAYTATAYNDGTSCTKALPATTPWIASGVPTVTNSSTSNGSGRNYPTVKTVQAQTSINYTCSPSAGKYYRYLYIKTRTKTSYAYVTLADDPLLSTTPTTTFAHADHRLVMFDTSAYKNFTSVTTPTGSSGSTANGSNLTTTWAGCIEERQTVPTNTVSYAQATGMSPSGLIDLDIDSAPVAADDATKWAPMWNGVAYNRNSLGVATSGSRLNASCPSAASLLAPMTYAQFSAAADALSPAGNTYLDVGLLWGARFSSPDGIWQTLVNETPTNGGTVNRHLVFMTDGDMNTNNSIQTTYGIETLDRRVTTDGVNTTADANHSKRYRAICDAIKAKGIRLWAIQFDDTLPSLQADLAYCASPASAFTAKNAAQLNAAFQEIAKQVGELRVLS